MTLPRTAAEVLSGHLTLEVRCIDRVMLTFRRPGTGPFADHRRRTTAAAHYSGRLAPTGDTPPQTAGAPDFPLDVPGSVRRRRAARRGRRLAAARMPANAA
jgi:hypothetical protein